jgi:hypothetical protein
VDTANEGDGATQNQQPGPVAPPAQGSYPYPTDAACTTSQPPQQLPCPAMVRCYARGALKKGPCCCFHASLHTATVCR